MKSRLYPLQMGQTRLSYGSTHLMLESVCPFPQEITIQRQSEDLQWQWPCSCQSLRRSVLWEDRSWLCNTGRLHAPYEPSSSRPGLICRVHGPHLCSTGKLSSSAACDSRAGLRTPPPCCPHPLQPGSAFDCSSLSSHLCIKLHRRVQRLSKATHLSSFSLMVCSSS